VTAAAIFLARGGACKEIYLEAVKQDGNIISSVPMVFRAEEMYIAAVSRDGRMLKHVPEKSKTGKTCNMAARNTRYYDFKYVLEQILEELRTAELYLEAVKNDGDALEFVPEELKAVVRRGGT